MRTCSRHLRCRRLWAGCPAVRGLQRSPNALPSDAASLLVRHAQLRCRRYGRRPPRRCPATAAAQPRRGGGVRRRHRGDRAAPRSRGGVACCVLRRLWRHVPHDDCCLSGGAALGSLPAVLRLLWHDAPLAPRYVACCVARAAGEAQAAPHFGRRASCRGGCDSGCTWYACPEHAARRHNRRRLASCSCERLPQVGHRICCLRRRRADFARASARLRRVGRRPRGRRRRRGGRPWHRR
mmetsp:Transcript_25440/g.84741  ORF Transcript_25440/g.84741 Transcript_25440/m.84741 type:complete len:238 (+) Transcript_25440:2095-2808(+)